jgi:hypothetical protein
VKSRIALGVLLGLFLGGQAGAQRIVARGISDPPPPDQVITQTAVCSGHPVSFSITLRQRPAVNRVTLRAGRRQATLPPDFMGGALTQNQRSSHIIRCASGSVSVDVRAVRMAEGRKPIFSGQSATLTWAGKLTVSPYWEGDTP